MTPEEIKAKASELAALYTAKANGKTLQHRIALDGANQWMDHFDGTGPHWGSDMSSWRVKPEPRTFWVLLNPDGEVIDATRHQARADRWLKDGQPVAKTSEVLP